MQHSNSGAAPPKPRWLADITARSQPKASSSASEAPPSPKPFHDESASKPGVKQPQQQHPDIGEQKLPEEKKRAAWFGPKKTSPTDALLDWLLSDHAAAVQAQVLQQCPVEKVP